MNNEHKQWDSLILRAKSAGKNFFEPFNNLNVLVVIAVLGLMLGFVSGKGVHTNNKELIDKLQTAMELVESSMLLAEQRQQELQSFEASYALKIQVLEDSISALKEQTKKQGMEERKAVTDWVYANSTKTSREDCSYVVEEAFKTDHPKLILALFFKESSFNASAVSSANAWGLGQITDVHTQELIDAGIINERRDLFDVHRNVKATEFVLKQKIVYADGDIHKALSLYLGADSASYHNTIYGKFMELNFLNGEEIQDEGKVKG